MHHFTRLSHKRLLALCLSAGLIMGSLSGCGSQGSAATDTIAEPAVSATVGTTDNTAFPLPEGPEESTIFVEPVDGISDDFYRGMDASAVLALEKFVSPKPTACIHCGRCVHACPLRLMPTEIAKAYRREDSEALGKLKVTLCMNCGCCTYACPAKRPVAETNQLAKAFYMSSIKK